MADLTFTTEVTAPQAPDPEAYAAAIPEMLAGLLGVDVGEVAVTAVTIHQAPAVYQAPVAMGPYTPPPEGPAPPTTPPAVAAFTFTPASPLKGASVAFDGSASSGLGALTYAWIFGDGGTGSGAQATHQYANKGTFSATLTVTDEAAQTAQQVQTVTVA